MAIQVAIEGYDSLEQIGVGGMAAVYRARKISIDKTVAIKVLFPYLATDETYIDRFQREARAAASIQHENVVNVIDFGESDGAFFIVMEYYDGRTLEQLMRDRPALPHDIAVQILLEVAFGLEAAHAVDVVHRDIKPANIIFTNQGGVKIADFGLARKSDSATLITQHGKVIGTPAYMSPEQAAGRPVGPAGDIFSLGVVAYELLGRCKPFEGKSYSDVLEKIQTFDPQPLSTINPLVPPEFERIVHRMLEKEESARIATAGELIAEFEAAMAHNGITRDRRQLALYARDPEPYDAAFVEKTVAGCLTRADEFLRQGASGADAAMLEFRRILTLDPEHERARAELDRLRNEYSHTQHTVTMDAVRPATTARSSSARRSIGVRTLPRWAYALAAVVAVVLAAVVFHPASRPAGDSQPGVSMGAGKQDSAFLAHAVTGADSSRSSRTSAHRDSTRTTGTERRTMQASPVEPLPGSMAGMPAATPRVAAPAPSSSTAARRVARKPEPAPAPGSLSVYYLGGLGELWVDGKLFSRQPPFDDAVLAAGTHHIACRMKGEQTMHELTVTIHSGVRTTIEYEIGGTPRVTEERPRSAE